MDWSSLLLVGWLGVELTLCHPLPSDNAAQYHVQGVQPQTESRRAPAADARAVVGEGGAEDSIHKGMRSDGRLRACWPIRSSDAAVLGAQNWGRVHS